MKKACCLFAFVWCLLFSSFCDDFVLPGPGTLSSSVSGYTLGNSLAYDTDAQSYFTRIVANSGTISDATKEAINAYVVLGKSQGWWTKHKVIAPLAGDQLAAAQVLLKYQAGTSGVATNVSGGFTEANYSSVYGLQCGNLKALDTGFNATNLTQPAIVGMSCFVATNSAANYTHLAMLGLFDGTSTLVLEVGSAGPITGNYQVRYSTGGQAAGTVGQSIQFVHGVRSATNLTTLYINGESITTASTVGTNNIGNGTFRIGGRGGSSPFAYFGGVLGFAAIDDGTLTAQEVLDFSNATWDLMKSLGRYDLLPQINYIPVTGQSLSISTSATGTPTSPFNEQLYQNWMHSFATIKPTKINWRQLMMNSSGDNHTYSLANRVSKIWRDAGGTPANKHDIWASAWGLDGTAYSGLAQGTAGYTNVLWAVTNAYRFRNRYASNGTFVVPMIVVVHGEGDASSSTYAANMITWQTNYETDIKVITGQTNTVYMLHSQPGSYGTGAAGVMGMASVCSSNYTIMGIACPKYMMGFSDGIHITAPYQYLLGEYEAKVRSYLISNLVWHALFPTNITRTNADIYLPMEGCVGDLVFDTTLVSSNANYGFEYTDASSPPAISSVTLIAPNTVKVTLASTPTGGSKKIRYAYSGTGGTAGSASSPRGNVHDSDPTPSVGTTAHTFLRNWLLGFDLVCP